MLSGFIGTNKGLGLYYYNQSGFFPSKNVLMVLICPWFLSSDLTS